MSGRYFTNADKRLTNSWFKGKPFLNKDRLRKVLGTSFLIYNLIFSSIFSQSRKRCSTSCEVIRFLFERDFIQTNLRIDGGIPFFRHISFRSLRYFGFSKFGRNFFSHKLVISDKWSFQQIFVNFSFKIRYIFI